MNRKIFSLLFVLSLFLGCAENKSYNVSYHTLKGELVFDSIYSRMPGSLYVLNDHIVWQDPFASRNFIHYIDKQTRNEIVAIGNIGQGPNEFATPSISKTYDDNILVYDLNSHKQAILITDSVVRKKQEHFVTLKRYKMTLTTRKINIADSTFVELNPASDVGIFRLLEGNKYFSFGRQFLKNVTGEPYNLYQGHINYNKDNKKLVYANSLVSYFSIYDFDANKNAFSLQNEIIEDYMYNRINEKKLTVNRAKRGYSDMTLSKDFIIFRRRDYRAEDVNERDAITLNDFEKVPRTVFLYDYKGNLKHIVNLEMPILRIAAHIKDNMLYIITTDPEYVIMKYDLDEFVN